MHGRLKVRTTAEQQEAKRKEREKKLKIYKAATAKVFQKRAAGEHDEEALHVTGEILAGNPDFSSLWNFRREIFTTFIKDKPKDELQGLFVSELGFLEACLKVNPKSYGTWHHREWVMDRMPEPGWKRELILCNKFLEYDERNFHCWDYRRIVVRKSEVSAQEEFDFSTSKISTNFSNFSSWHYRSKLLPILHPDPTQNLGVKESVLNEEYELVQNAYFTDPNDQSAWFYHRWLLGRGEKSLEIDCIIIQAEDRQLVLRFSKPTEISKQTLAVSINNEIKDLEFKTAGTKYSKVWTTPLDGLLCDDKQTRVDIKMNATQEYACVCEAGEQYGVWQAKIEQGGSFRNTMSAATAEIRTQEFESIQQLHDLEPDNKWVLLTMLSLARAVDPQKYAAESKESLVKLRQVDPCRRNYYNDLESKYTIEDVIESTNGTKLDLHDRGLTTLYHTELMVTFTEVDLSQNALHAVKDAGYFRCCRTLVLDDNKLESLRDVRTLRSLRSLCVKNNLITDVIDLEMLKDIPTLRTLDISGNPLCKDPDVKEKVNKLLPNVNIKL